jgi:hypothetical protein
MERPRLMIVRRAIERGLLGLTLGVGLALWFARGPSDCKQSARPLIDALEQYHLANGRYPESLETLIETKLLRSLPRPTWNLGVQHTNRFEYWVEPDLDYYCLAYAEAPIRGGSGPPHWDQITYVSFRGGWDDSPAVPRFDLFWLPVERASKRYRQSRSSADLRLLVNRLGGATPEGCSIFWDDVVAQIGPGLPGAVERQSGFVVQAGDQEAAAFFFVTRRARTLRGDKTVLIKLSEFYKVGDAPNWRDVFRDANQWEWLEHGPAFLSPHEEEGPCSNRLPVPGTIPTAPCDPLLIQTNAPPITEVSGII